MTGYISEIAAIAMIAKLVTALPSFFYGGPIGWLTSLSLILLSALVAYIVNQIVQPDSEYGESIKSGTLAFGIFCAVSATIATPVILQAQTMMTRTQYAHVMCIKETYGTNTDKCFAKWVRTEQARASKQG